MLLADELDTSLVSPQYTVILIIFQTSSNTFSDTSQTSWYTLPTSRYHPYFSYKNYQNTKFLTKYKFQYTEGIYNVPPFEEKNDNWDLLPKLNHAM